MSNATCPFCATDDTLLTFVNFSAIAMPDKFPVTPGHTLILPKRHVSSVFNLESLEWTDCFDLIKRMRQHIVAQDPSVTGFNIGINEGADAGQTIAHCHIHLIPRRKDDIPNPRGGVRNVIASRGDYLSKDDSNLKSSEEPSF